MEGDYKKDYIDRKTGKGPFWIRKNQAPPNIFLITVDMLPPQFYLHNHPGINTPALDSLKADGIFFTNAFASAPLCGPSRASYLTGRYTYITGNSERSHDGHLTELRNNDIIWPEYLKAAGYYTRHSGKSHIGTEIFTRVFSENDAPWHRWSPPWYDDEAYLQFLRQKGLRTFSFKREIKGLSWSGKGYGSSYGGWLADQNGKPFPEDATYPAFLVEKAINSIENRSYTGSHTDKPLYVQLDFFGPHQPFAIPGGWEEREGEIRKNMKVPKSWEKWAEIGFKNIPQQPRVYNMYRKNWGMKQRETLINYRIANQLQFELIDKIIGKYINYLKKENLYDNSLIIFIADHGEMNGEWGCIDKGAYLNPQVLRVPIIFKIPKNLQVKNLQRKNEMLSSNPINPDPTKWRGTICDTPCSLLDIAPTVLEIAGLKIPERLDGFSLLKTLSEGTRPEDKPILFDVWNHVVPNPSVGMIFKSASGQYYMYTYNATDKIDELYNISDQSVESSSGLTNLFHDPQYESVYQEALHTMNKYLSLDDRWEVYKGYFQLENAEKLNLPPMDTQKFT